ncbi:hypothetical protein E2C01_011666 [Portunus trituberculatus]|uniref:Secreted protein n=1 Tax=Portunus trituberculatus TaxID=210409 RepID=A0A5B7DBW8_PORTR|nr:hypothetical protein [Portunus trituberculatus]
MVHWFTAHLMYWFTAHTTKLWLKRHATQPLPHTKQHPTTLTTPHAAHDTATRDTAPQLSEERPRHTKGDLSHYKHPAALLPIHNQALSWTRLHNAVSMWRPQQTCHEALY